MCHLLRINPFHLRKDMLIYTEFKSWVYCAATVEISSDTQILVSPQCAITDSLLNARKSGNVHSSALQLRSCPLLLLLLLLMIMMMTMIVTMMTMMMVMMMTMLMMMICMILIIKLVMMRYTSDSLIILTYPKTRHSVSMKQDNLRYIHRLATSVDGSPKLSKIFLCLFIMSISFFSYEIAAKWAH